MAASLKIPTDEVEKATEFSPVTKAGDKREKPLEKRFQDQLPDADGQDGLARLNLEPTGKTEMTPMDKLAFTLGYLDKEAGPFKFKGKALEADKKITAIQKERFGRKPAPNTAHETVSSKAGDVQKMKKNVTSGAKDTARGGLVREMRKK